MSACETCWGDAYARSRMLGGSQVEHYQALLKERSDDHAEWDALRDAPTTAGEGERGEG
jgi:hypothetical protein